MSHYILGYEYICLICYPVFDQKELPHFHLSSEPLHLIKIVFCICRLNVIRELFLPYNFIHNIASRN
jgi:hypothetical protein